ncbi:uncharacterized protein LOC143588664 [Bidens hawaiensis]|uniref:uncharacterized protein LOC143588664 n=1 Tax=Bidens hawaiensis TaxID=980011 RepID=UPI00404A8BA2
MCKPVLGSLPTYYLSLFKAPLTVIEQLEQVRRDIEFLLFGQDTYVHNWLKWVPIKVNAFVWRAVGNKIPTMEALIRRGVQLPNAIYKSCGSSIEDLAHLFFDCSLAKRIWLGIQQWTGYKVSECNSLHQLVSLPFSGAINGKMRDIIYTIILATCWCLWKARNAKVFRSETLGADKILDNVKVSSFAWIKHSAKIETLEWSSWCMFDFSWS